MKKIGIGLDYNNICKDYNTVYLDRDNNDKETMECMTKVLRWFKPFLTEVLENFAYDIYRMNHQEKLKIDDIVNKRFFFYSLEKEITMQTFILQKEHIDYGNLEQWSEKSEDSLLIQNDAEGEGVYFYFNEGSNMHEWLLDRLKEFSLDDLVFEQK